MAAFNSAATGDWNAGPTWGSVNNPGTAGVDYPGVGDSATISTHTVTVPVSTTSAVGTAPDDVTTYGLVISSTGQIVIDGTLNVTTNFDITGGGVVTVNGGGTLNFDPSARTVTKEYRFRCGNSGTGKLVLNNNATVTAPDGSAWYQQSGTVNNASQIDINGTASQRARMVRMQRSASALGWNTGLNITSAGKFEASYCTFEACDDFTFTGSGTFTIRWEWCKWVNSTGTQNLILNSTNVTKQIYNCTFDLNPQGTGGWGSNLATAIDCSECYFDGGYGVGTSTGGFVDGRYNVKRSTASGGTQSPTPFTPPSGGTRITHEILWKDTTASNPHWGGINNTTTGARTVRGPIYLYEGTAVDGDCVMPDPTDNVLTTLRDMLFARNGGGNQVGTWLSQLGESGPGTTHTIAYEHCTGAIAGTSTRGISVGETNTSQPDRVVSVKSNLAVEQTAGSWPGNTTGLLTQMQSSQSLNDPFTETDIDYNWVFATNAVSPATVYCSTASSPAVGTQTLPTAANDIYGEDPQFIDSFRRMPQWAQWWGTRTGANGDNTITPGTAATAVNARLLLNAMHDGSFPEAVTSTAMQMAVQWIRRGWIPTNAAGRAAGHDGLTPGIFGAWAPALSGLTASSSGASCTTNAPDGTIYWVLTSSATVPDWDRIIAGQDHTGASLPAAQKGSVAVSTISPSWSYSPDPGTYYLHIVHSADATTNGDPAQEDYLRTSAETSSASFAVSAGGGGGTNRILTTVAVTRQWGGSRGRRAA